MTLYKWSQTASSDATADPTINWAEGQAPSSVNDSARAMMVATAKYRDDIAGAIVTSGTSTAYTVSSYQVFDTLAHLSGQIIAFTPHATNGATVTLNVDSLGARPLRSSPGVELLAGTIIQGTPYVAVYNNADAAFYLRGFFGNPYNVPLGAGMDYWLPTAPNSSFVFPTGQAISRTTYATLFSAMGTAYGPGDGSSTFNLPDKTGRVSAMMEAAASRLTPSYFGGNSASLGAVGGGESHQLTLNETPTGITSSNASNPITVSSGGNNIPVTTGLVFQSASGAAGGTVPAESGGSPWNTSINSMSGNNALAVTSNNTGGQPHRTVQPTIVCNYILRII
jgi:microcystin-dependent protein